MWFSVARILLFIFCGKNLLLIFCGTNRVVGILWHELVASQGPTPLRKGWRNKKHYFWIRDVLLAASKMEMTIEWLLNGTEIAIKYITTNRN